MKHRSLILFLLITILISVAPLQAQSPVTAIDSLSIDLWPDFDQEAVLVLLTGILPSPGTITIPLPADADFHVLARVDDQGNMFDDLGTPTFGNGMMTFTTPDTRFRIEYYMPYTSSGTQRNFTYSWLADIPVKQLFVSVQQPAAAISLTTEPATSGQVQNPDDGLIYHNLAAQTVQAGQPLTIRVNYTMSRNILTVASNPPVTSSGSSAAAVVDTANNNLSTWALVLGVAGLLLIVVAVTWQLAAHRTPKRKPAVKRPSTKTTPSKPAPARKATPAPGKVKFCHECGEPAQSSDRFCRRCGTELKRL